jgi:hypothetical protein
LQKGEIVGADIGLAEFAPSPHAESVAETHGARDVPGRDHLFYEFDGEIDQHPLGRAEHVADPRRDHMRDGRLRQAFFKDMGEIFQDDDGGRAGIDKLVFKFARRIERIAIDDDISGAQDPEQRHGILQQVRHHQRDARASRQLQARLQVSGEIAGVAFEFTECDPCPHIDECGARREFFGRLNKDFANRPIGVNRRVRRNANRIIGEPDFLHNPVPPAASFFCATSARGLQLFNLTHLGVAAV